MALLRLGQRVLLLDASGPANARASSGGESRMTRTIYGADDVYTRMAWDSLEDWRWLSKRAGTPIFYPIGVLMFFGKREPFAEASIEAHRRMRLRLGVLDRPELQRRYANNVADERAYLALDRDRGQRARVGYLTNQPRTFGITARVTF